MEFSEGDIVYDRWWPWRTGHVVQKLKTRTRVLFTAGGPQEIVSYDLAHARRFLEREAMKSPRPANRQTSDRHLADSCV